MSITGITGSVTAVDPSAFSVAGFLFLFITFLALKPNKYELILR